MLTASLLVLLALVLLVWSADRLVYGAAAIANNFGIPPLIIGLTIVAMGSSAPEIMVAINASLAGQPDTAIGNAIGSNITNIALVLGMTALVCPLTIASSTLKRELPLVLFITLAASLLMLDGSLALFDGVLLLAGFLAVNLWLLRQTLKHRDTSDPILQESEDEVPVGVKTPIALFWLVIGGVLLPLSADLLVDNASTIARSFGISELVIGLTIIAIGTSLPELAASMVGALKGEDDLAVGNVIGSNMFNLLAVLPMPALLSPGAFDSQALTRDVPIMGVLTVVLLLMAYGRKGKRQLTRWEGALLLTSFVVYQALLVIW